jgi:undecaprenyl-diphosphatase
MLSRALRSGKLIGLLAALVAIAGAVRAAESGAAPEPAEAAPLPGEGAPLGYGAAAGLGVVEGLTEFLPVSSTGHLVLANHFFALDHESPARDAAGRKLWKRPPDPETGFVGESYTVKAAADTYSIIIQVGAILAVAIIYWRQIVGIFAGLLGRDPAGLRLLRNLLIAFFPAVVLGLTLHNYIEEHLFSIQTVTAALVVGAFVMLITSRWQHLKATRAGDALPDPAPADLTPIQALIIGVLQCFALWPGMSRSMMTLVGGYLVGLRPARSAEFTFLLGLPTLAGAAVFKAHGSGLLMVKALGMAPLLVGGAVAAVSAAIAVRWMVGYLTRHGLALFAWYRLMLAVAVLIITW